MSAEIAAAAERADGTSDLLAAAPVVGRLTGSLQRYPKTAGTVPDGTALLHLNETPSPPSPRAVEAVAAAAAGLNRYPTPAEPALVATLAALNETDVGGIVLGAGSDELVQAIVAAFAAPETVVVSSEPGFPKYRQSATLHGLGWRGVPLDPQGVPVPDSLAAAAGEGRGALLFISSPHNPTGGTWTPEHFHRLASLCPPRTLVVVDAAYGEFSDEPRATCLPRLLSDTSLDWMILRTMSKAHGLAGARIGYGVARRPEVAEAVRRVLPVFSVNALALAAAAAALADQDHLARVVAENGAAREAMRRRLADLGLHALPSQANFLAVDLRRAALPVAAALQARRVLVACMNHPGYENYIRVSIGSTAENDRFIAALEAAFEEEHRHGELP